MIHYHHSIDVSKLPVPALVFKLPSGAGGMAAGFNLSRIIQKMNEWSKKYNIGYSHKRVCTNTLEVYLDDPKRYDFFCLTWNGSPFFVITEESERIRNLEPISHKQIDQNI